MLQIALVVVEWAVLSSRLQSAGILDHLLIEQVEVLVGDYVLDNHEAILVQVSHRRLQVPIIEFVGFYFGG